MKCCDLSSGQLRHRITFEVENTAEDNTGGLVSGWSVHLVTRANIVPLSGNELLHSQQLKTNVTHKMYLRFAKTITTKMRIKFDDREFQIRAAINMEERSRWLEISAMEGQVN